MQCGSNLRPLGLESNTLPLSHCASYQALKSHKDCKYQTLKGLIRLISDLGLCFVRFSNIYCLLLRDFIGEEKWSMSSKYCGTVQKKARDK